jgi:hypothetical protein
MGRVPKSQSIDVQNLTNTPWKQHKLGVEKRQKHLWVVPLGTSHFDFPGPIEL